MRNQLFVYSRTAVLILASLSLLAMQKAENPGDVVGDFTIPPLTNGDGRHRLSEFRGQPLLFVTLSSAIYGTDLLDLATKLGERHAEDGLVVIATYLQSPGEENVDIEAMATKYYSGRPFRLCKQMPWTWKWNGLGWPPYYAVVGPDGRMVGLGNLGGGPASVEGAVAKAVQQTKAGWGSPAEASVRALVYGRGRLAEARQKAPEELIAEVDTALKRRIQVVEWCLDDGQWLRGLRELNSIVSAAGDVPEWKPLLDRVRTRIEGKQGAKELELDAKVESVLKPFVRKLPSREAQKKLLQLAESAPGSCVGARAKRLAGAIERARGGR